jgi:hypothetical protein
MAVIAAVIWAERGWTLALRTGWPRVPMMRPIAWTLRVRSQ